MFSRLKRYRAIETTNPTIEKMRNASRVVARSLGKAPEDIGYLRIRIHEIHAPNWQNYNLYNISYFFVWATLRQKTFSYNYGKPWETTNRNGVFRDKLNSLIWFICRYNITSAIRWYFKWFYSIAICLYIELHFFLVFIKIKLGCNKLIYIKHERLNFEYIINTTK